MRKKGTVFLLLVIVTIAWWWVTRSSADPAPQEGVLDLWVTWGDEADRLQAFFDTFAAGGDVPVRVRTRVRSDDVLEALSGVEAPDLIILSNADLVRSYHEQGLIEPLTSWIEAAQVDLETLFPALLEQCRAPDGEYACLPWGGDVEALYWNEALFSAADLDPRRAPQSMEELLTYASQLSRRNEEGDLVQVGFIPDFPRSHMEQYALQRGAHLNPVEGFAASDRVIVDTLTWQRQFYELYAAGQVDVFVASLTPYTSSTHPTYAGKRLDCRQCHRSSRIHDKKTPDTIFFEGHLAMMVSGQWQVMQGDSISGGRVNVGVAPLPLPAAYSGRAKRAVVQGPVLIVPLGSVDRDAVVSLLAWMMSPARLADVAYAYNFLPASAVAAQDVRFQGDADLAIFLELLSSAPGPSPSAMPDRAAFNGALAELEKVVLHQGGAVRPLVDEFQRTLALRREEAVGYRLAP